VTDCAGVEVAGTALGIRDLLFLQMTEVAPQSSGGKRSPRGKSTSPIEPGATSQATAPLL